MNADTEARLTESSQIDEATEVPLEDMERYAPLIPIFGAVEEIFDAWERAVRLVELETEPPKWTKQLNRVAKRNIIFGRGDPQPSRSRIRRSINRVARQKGWYK